VTIDEALCERVASGTRRRSTSSCPAIRSGRTARLSMLRNSATPGCLAGGVHPPLRGGRELRRSVEVLDLFYRILVNLCLDASASIAGKLWAP